MMVERRFPANTVRCNRNAIIISRNKITLNIQFLANVNSPKLHISKSIWELCFREQSSRGIDDSGNCFLVNVINVTVFLKYTSI